MNKPTKKKIINKPSAQYWTGSYYNNYEEVNYKTLSELFEAEKANYNLDFDEALTIYFEYPGKQTREFRLAIHPFNFCCGVFELGELSSSILNDEDMNKVFLRLFDYHNNRSFILTTNHNQKNWNTWLKATKLFNLTKVFLNKGSGNKVYIWTSTN